MLGKKEKSYADKVLSLWLLFIGIHLTLFYIYFSGQYIHFPYLLGMEIPLPLIHGPFLFLYTTSLTSQSTSMKHKWVHFLPFVISYLFFIGFFATSYDNKIEVYQAKGKGYEVQMFILRLATAISGIAYLSKSLIVLKNHKRNIANQFSYLEKINLDWLRYLILGLCIIWLIILLHVGDEYIFGAVVLYVIFIGYYGINQVGIFTQHPNIYGDSGNNPPGYSPAVEISGTAAGIKDESTETASEKKNVHAKYSKSSLSDAAARAIHQKLVKLMEENKLYRNPELTLAELSQRLNVHPNILSQVINTLEQKNFYDYINVQRIQEFKQIVNAGGNQRFTLLSLAYDCGFNSKSSFNRNFKKIAGISPSEYLSGLNMRLE